MVSHLLILLAIAFISLASPVLVRENEARLAELQELYPGILWEEMFETYTEEQQNIIVEATRVVVNDLIPVFANSRELERSAAFNRFFIRHREPFISVGWDHTIISQHKYKDIISAHMGITRHITEGGREKDGEISRRKRIMYTCKEVNKLKPCRFGTKAQTHEPYKSDPPGWTTNFCPLFFSTYTQYMLDAGNAPDPTVDLLQTLHTREHVIMHELAHADVASRRGGPTHITDRFENFTGHGLNEVVNGAVRSQMYAWLNSDHWPSAINLDTGMNADNFAWVWTNAWFAKRWGWKDDGHPSRHWMEARAIQEDDPISNDEAEDESTTLSAEELRDMDPGTESGCIQLSDDPLDVECIYHPGSREDWLAEKDLPFTSKGGCELSKECHMPFGQSMAVDPKCVCKCDGDMASLSDERCAGFEGNAPFRSSPPNGAPPPS